MSVSALHYSNFDALAWDFDGVWVESDAVHTRARLQAYEELATELDEPALAEVDPAIHAEGHHHGSNPRDINAWVIEQAGVEVKGVDIVEAIVVRKKAIYASMAQEGLPARCGAVNLAIITAMHWKDKISLVTTAHLEEEVRPFLVRYNLQSLFPDEQLVTFEDVENLKPHPEAYLEVLSRIGLEERPSGLLVVEDTPKGIEAANAAGATTVGLWTPEHGEALEAEEGAGKPDHIVQNHRDLRLQLGL